MWQQVTQHRSRLDYSLILHTHPLSCHNEKNIIYIYRHLTIITTDLVLVEKVMDSL